MNKRPIGRKRIHPSLGPNEDARGIYKITNTVNSKVYVGIAIHFRTRWLAHLQRLASGTHPNPGLQNDWKTHGPEAFRFETIEWSFGQAPHIDLTREMYWIERLRAEGTDLYNQDPQKLAHEARRRNKAMRVVFGPPLAEIVATADNLTDGGRHDPSA